MANDSEAPPVEQLQTEQDRQQIRQSGHDPFARAREAAAQPMPEGKGKILDAIGQAGKGTQTQQELTLTTPKGPEQPSLNAIVYGLRAGAHGVAGGATTVLEGLNALVDTVDPVRSQVRGAALILKGVIQMGLSPLAVPAGVIGQQLENMVPELAKHTVVSGMAAAGVKGLLDPLGAIASATDIGSGTPEAQARLSAASNALTEPITFRQAVETGVQVATMIAAGSVVKGAKGGAKQPAESSVVPPAGAGAAGQLGKGPPAEAMGLPKITGDQLTAFTEKATAEPGAAVPPEGTQGTRIFGVNWKRLGQEQDVNRVILQVNKDLAGQGKMPATEGAVLPTTAADIAARAKTLGVTLEDVMNLPALPKRVTSIEELDAFTTGVRGVRDVIANRLLAEAKMGAAGDLGARANTQALLALAMKAAEADKLTGENLAQAMSARRMPSNADTAGVASQAVMDFVDRIQGLTGNEHLPEMLTAVAKPKGKARTFIEHVGNVLSTGKGVLWEVWINDLLGPVTAGAKAVGDVVMLAKEPPQRMLARWNQQAFPMLFDGKPLELIAPNEGWVFARAAAEQIPTAVMQALRGVRDGEVDIMTAVGEARPYPQKFSADTLGLRQPESLMDFSPGSLPGKLVNALGMTIRAPGTTLGVITKVAKAANYAGAAEAVATREALFQGLEGTAKTKYVKDAVENASANSAIAEEGAATAQGNTFTNELGPFGQALTAALNTAHMRSQAPFLRVPFNLEKTATQMIPPFNLPSVLWGEMRQALEAGGVQRARAMASLETGALLSATVAYLTSKGIITGNGPNNRALEEQRAAAGVPVHSLILGGTAYDYNKIKPLGTMLGLTATATEAWAQLPHTESGLAQMGQIALIHALSWGRVIKDASYFTGIKDLVAAISSDDATVAQAGGHFLKSTARSLPPNTWMRTPNRLFFDHIMRDAGTAQEAFLAGVPGYSQTVAPHVDMLHGEPMEYPASLGPGLVSPVPVHIVNPDPMAKTLADNGIVIKALPWKVYPGKDDPAIPLKDTPVGMQGIDITSWQRYQWSQLMLKESAGGKTMYEALQDRIAHPAFQRASPGPGGGRDALVQDVVRAYQKMGHDRLLLENDQLRDNVAARERERVINKWTGGETKP